jgi:hypothetical protein
MSTNIYSFSLIVSVPQSYLFKPNGTFVFKVLILSTLNWGLFGKTFSAACTLKSWCVPVSYLWFWMLCKCSFILSLNNLLVWPTCCLHTCSMLLHKLLLIYSWITLLLNMSFGLRGHYFFMGSGKNRGISDHRNTK